MVTLGEVIQASRRKRAMSQAQLGAAVGLAQNVISNLENDALKSAPDANTLIRISDALNAPEILIHHCDTCPIRAHIMLRMFPELNNIRHDPAIIMAKLRKEMVEATEAAERLGERYTDAGFQGRPDYQATFEKEMEQILDVKRAIEILEFELILSGLHSQEDIDRVYARQQAKCEQHGHHIPARTGTEG